MVIGMIENENQNLSDLMRIVVDINCKILMIKLYRRYFELGMLYLQ